MCALSVLTKPVSEGHKNADRNVPIMCKAIIPKLCESSNVDMNHKQELKNVGLGLQPGLQPLSSTPAEDLLQEVL